MTWSPPQPARVVVGVDGSAHSLGALRAGERAAVAAGGTLVAVTVWGPPAFARNAPAIAPDPQELASTLQRETLRRAFPTRCRVPVESVIRSGRPAQVLLRLGEGATVLVVGSRGHGGIAGLLLGSVSTAVAARASCPVLVLHEHPGRPRVERRPRVVVGVGGSAVSTPALRLGAEAAARLHAELVAVTAWEDTAVSPDPYWNLRSTVAERATADLDLEIAKAFGDTPPARIRRRALEGAVSRVLVAESARAELVVVGRSVRTQLAALLLGSVALPVVEHAHCPVLVVPDDQPRLADARGAPRGASVVRCDRRAPACPPR